MLPTVERAFSVTEALVTSSVVMEVMSVSEGGDNGDFLRTWGFVGFCLAWSLQTLTILHSLARADSIRDALRFLVEKEGYDLFKKPSFGKVKDDSNLGKLIGNKRLRAFLKNAAESEYFFGIPIDVKSLLGLAFHTCVLVVGILCFEGTICVEKITDALLLTILPIIGEVLSISDLWEKEGKLSAIAAALDSKVIDNMFADRKFNGVQAFYEATTRLCCCCSSNDRFENAQNVFRRLNLELLKQVDGDSNV